MNFNEFFGKFFKVENLEFSVDFEAIYRTNEFNILKKY